MEYLYLYLIIINIIAIIATILDKRAAVSHRWRVKEFTLMFIAFMGGSVTMYLTMLIIRHKTRKMKFMLGIPLIILFQLAVIYLVLHYVYRIL